MAPVCESFDDRLIALDGVEIGTEQESNRIAVPSDLETHPVLYREPDQLPEHISPKLGDFDEHFSGVKLTKSQFWM